MRTHFDLDDDMRSRSRTSPPEHSLRSAIVDALTFLTGLWLVLSPFLLDHGGTGPGFNAFWNDGLTGAALLLLGATSLVDPSARRTWSPFRLPLGAWLISAPAVLEYDIGTAPQVTTSDLIAGSVVLALWLFSNHATSTVRRGSGREDQ